MTPEHCPTMTKWITFLLLLLALLAFGLSQMRPVPEATTTSTPVEAATPEAGLAGDPPGSSTGDPATPSQLKAPKFGPPGQVTPAPAPLTTPGIVAGGGKADPFSPSGKKDPEPVMGTIKATTLSTSTDGPARTKFPSSTETIYLTATPERLKSEVEVVASYRSVLNEEDEFSSSVPSSGPPRRRVFRLTPPAGGWEDGPYQVVMKTKSTGQVLGIERFEILGPEEKLPENLPSPEYIDLVPNLQAEKPKNVYDSTDKRILLRVSAQELPAGTPIRTVWSAVEVDRLTTGELIAVSDQPAPGPGQDAVFTFEAPPGGFHTGSYQVDIYFDQELAGSHAFFIQPPARTPSDR